MTHRDNIGYFREKSPQPSEESLIPIIGEKENLASFASLYDTHLPNSISQKLSHRKLRKGVYFSFAIKFRTNF